MYINYCSYYRSCESKAKTMRAPVKHVTTVLFENFVFGLLQNIYVL